MAIESSLALLNNRFGLSLILKTVILKLGSDRFNMVRKHVDVDVGTLADVSRQDASDQPRAESIQQAHYAECFQSHLLEPHRMVRTFQHAGQVLDFVADFCIAR